MLIDLLAVTDLAAAQLARRDLHASPRLSSTVAPHLFAYILSLPLKDLRREAVATPILVAARALPPRSRILLALRLMEQSDARLEALCASASPARLRMTLIAARAEVARSTLASDISAKWRIAEVHALLASEAA